MGATAALAAVKEAKGGANCPKAIDPIMIQKNTAITVPKI